MPDTFDDPFDNIPHGLAGWSKWANIPTNEMAKWALVFLKGTPMEYRTIDIKDAYNA